MNDHYQQNPDQNAYPAPSGAPRSGLLRDYRQGPPNSASQPAPFKQFSPVGGQFAGPQGSARPSAPLGSPQEVPQQPMPRPPTPSFSSQPPQPPENRGFLAGTMQMVRQLSGKMVSLNRAAYEPPSPPLALYHSQPLSEPQLKVKRWRRSRALRSSMRSRHRRVTTRPSGSRLLTALLISVLTLLIVTLSSSGAYAYSFYQHSLPQVNNIAHQQISQVSRFYDRNGVFLGDVSDQNVHGQRTYVDIQYIPRVMQDAMVAAENRTFWTDSGIDPQGITRAALDYVSHGFKVQQGASTLTQQLIKNLTENDQVTVNRKVNEAFLAVGMTQTYPKEKILEMYLNVAPFGTTRLGVETAAQQYFGLSRQCNQDYAKGVFQCAPAIAQLDYDPVKKTHDPVLALARATFLSSLPQDPAHYDPFVWSYYNKVDNVDYRSYVLSRQQAVLAAMTDMGTSVKGLGPNGTAGPVTPAIAQQVSKMMSTMTFKQAKYQQIDPNFLSWVISQLEISLGNGDSTQGAYILNNGGFNVRTTIDSNLEAYVERVIKHQLDDLTYQKFLTPPYVVLSDPNGHNVGNAAAVVMNSKTGEILALAGSKDYNDTKDERVNGQYDVATANDGIDTGRQTGSTFKPIVYATALEMGMYPALVMPDTRTYFPNGQPSGTTTTKSPDGKGIWIPDDYGKKPGNWVLPMRDNLADSFNIPAGKVMAFAGADNVYNTAVRMGLTQLEKISAPCLQGKTNMALCLPSSTVLGTANVPLIQLTGAYQVFSDNGVHVPQQVVLDIWDNYGNHLYHFDPAHVQKVQVLSPQVAYIITAMLSDERARYREFLTDHDLSFWDWDYTCQTQIYRPYPDCQQHQVAAKTGTTDSFFDNLTVGYTPDVVVGVWAGNDDPAKDPLRDVVGITGAAPIWHSIIERVSGKPCDDADGVKCGPLNLNGLGLSNQGTFTQPDPGTLEVKCVSSADGLMGAGGNCDLFIPGQEPLQAGVFTASPNKDGNNNGNNNNGNNNNGNNNGGNNNNGNNNGGNNNGGNNNGGNNNGNNNGGNNNGGNNNGGNNGGGKHG